MMNFLDESKILCVPGAVALITTEIGRNTFHFEADEYGTATVSRLKCTPSETKGERFHECYSSHQTTCTKN